MKKSILFFTLFLGMFVCGTYVFAQSELTLQLPEFASSNSPADFVNNFYIWALGIAGTIAVVRVIFGGVKYVVSAGNTAQQGDARDIITSAIWGILLLAGAYLILNTINPQLTELRNPNLTTIPASLAPETGVPGGVEGSQASLAASILNSPNIILGVSADCSSGTSARSIMQQVANSQLPMVCSPSCSCEVGGPSGDVNLSSSMLSAILGASDGFRSKVHISSLSGGKHSASSLHYQGRAADFVLLDTKDPQAWEDFITLLTNRGSSRAFCELDGNSVACSNLFNEVGRIPGAHIHAEW